MSETNTKVIGVLTSGGDSQGMNAVIRSVVRIGLLKKFKVFLIYEGYNGLLGDTGLIKEANLFTVDHIIHEGGTVIGSSRCLEFRGSEGRIRAALTLIERDITNLVIIGGDGSLTGANILKKEWPSILDTLRERDKITEDMKNRNNYLNIVGIVGSIDNDFCSTEITTGTDTALHRIVESVDAIATTARSHQRAMIIEVMGRNCGYLALVSALACEATFTFIPESPPPEDWPEYLCNKIEYERNNGRRINLIIISEGALDLNGNRITAAQVKAIVKEKAKRDVRITILGHIQRGGHASAFDSILGSRMGATAVIALEAATSSTESCVLALNGNKIIGKSLMESVEQTQAVGTAMKNKEWEKCLQLRGNSFSRNLKTYRLLQKMHKNHTSSGNRFAVVQVGEPCPGMNASVLAFVRYLIREEHIVYGIEDGLDGLISGKLFEIKWSHVNTWTSRSGALLGTSKIPTQIPEQQLTQVAKNLKGFDIKGVLMIGGFRAFQLALILTEMRKTFTEFKIPICIIPATIDNSIPGTDLSLGTDTALNKIARLCTDIIVSSKGTKRRLFVIKLETGYCGYLTLMSALATGADYCYICEDDFTIDNVKRDANKIKLKMETDDRNRIIIVNGFANNKLNDKSIVDIYTEEGKTEFSTYFVDLANLEQSLSPSPFDRILGIKLGVKCADWFIHSTELPESDNTVVIGIRGKRYLTTNIRDLIINTDFEHEVPKEQWYLRLKDLINVSS